MFIIIKGYTNLNKRQLQDRLGSRSLPLHYPWCQHTQHRPNECTYLVEFVDQADSLVCQNQRPSLQRPLPGDGVSLDVRRQPHSRRPLPRGVHNPRRCLLNILQKLGLGSARIATQKNVNVSSHFVLSSRVFRFPAENCQGNCTLDVFVAINWRSNTGKNLEFVTICDLILQKYFRLTVTANSYQEKVINCKISFITINFLN